ncbi:hypothetical protein ACR3P1_002791 [Shigella flexneri]
MAAIIVMAVLYLESHS